MWELPKKCDFTPGVPVRPVLSKATKDVTEILIKSREVELTCEYSHDGNKLSWILRQECLHFFQSIDCRLKGSEVEALPSKRMTEPDIILKVAYIQH